jgi:hypothetical protein
VFEYRVTKFDPGFRDSNGVFTRDEWTSFHDIGHAFGGVVMTAEEYRRVEGNYVMAAINFLRESGQTYLLVDGLEESQGSSGLREGQRVGIDYIAALIRQIPREEFWCRLEGHECYLHFGWDYCLYVGVPRECSASIQLAKNLGLFVEPFQSPYKRELDDADEPPPPATG